MRSVRTEDQTAKARIREAAIDLFGRQGFGATTVRQIATQAGVSQALVMHHYGDKEALHQACDEYVVEEVFAHQAHPAHTDVSTIDRLVRDSLPESPSIRYMVRLLTEPSDVGDGLWDKLAPGTRVMSADGSTGVSARPDPDRDAQTQVLLAVGMSLVVFARHIARGLGVVEMDAAVPHRDRHRATRGAAAAKA